MGSGSETLFQAGAVHILYGGRRHLKVRSDQYLTEDTPGIGGGGASYSAWFGYRFAAGDFNGDRYSDLAIGSPFKYLAGGYEVGAVHILYGSRRGLTAKGDQYLTENSPGIRGGEAKSEDAFGFGLAASDFNLDGRDDLAIGAPNKDVANQDSDDGAVHVIYGGHRHLRVRSDQYLTAKNLGYATGSTAGAGFGTALAAGDLNGDRRADLVVGSPREVVGNDHNAGAVRVLFGGADRLRRRGTRLFTEASRRMAGPGANSFDEFGSSFAIGRFNRGGRRDLAIGVPDASNQKGAVHVLYGARRGPSLRGDQYLTTRTPGINGSGWAFGYALAGGDVNGDGRDELAIGAPLGNSGGAVHILYGARRHLRVRSDQYLTQGTPGLAGDEIRADEQFGFALGVVNFDGDRRSDLAIGEPQDSYDPQYGQCLTPGGGGVHVLYGARKRLSLKGDQFLTQDSPGIAGDGSEPCDGFGKALSGATR